MITGAHVIVFSRDADADRAFLRDVIGLDHVDAGGGWLIFALPTTEAAVHPDDGGDRHELYLTCGDIEAFRAHLAGHGVVCSAPHDEPWGTLVRVTLPGGGTLGVYQPRHAQPG